MSRQFLYISVAIGMLAIGCGRANAQQPQEQHEAKPAESASREPEHEHEGIPKTVRLDPKVEADAKVRVEPAVVEVLRATLSLPGEIAADPDKSARVASPVAGRIEKVSFREGASVKKGDLLLEIRIPELGKIRAAHAAAATKARAARTNAKRLQALLDKGLAAEQEVANVKAEAESLEAEERALAGQLSALGMSQTGGGSSLALRAPVSGIVLKRDAIVGQPVAPEQILASIADLGEVWFLARVFEKDLGKIRVGASAEIVLNAYPNEPLQGDLEYIGQQVDPAARTVTARIRLKNRKDMARLGLFGSARVVLEESSGKPPSLVIPRSAVIEIAGKTVAFVRSPDGQYQLHEVVLGASAAGKVEVISGLEAGEPVVVEGVFTLKSVLLKSTMEEDE